MHKIGVGTFSATDKMREYVNNILDTGRISYGPYSRQLEQRFADIHYCKFGVLSNSGTSSLQVALQAMKELHGWKDGDEVLVPSVTFVATVNIVLHNKMVPVLVDVEGDMYGMDPYFIEEQITPRTRAIIPVHLFGMPCAMSEIRAIARIYDLLIIEDSCECMFARHYGMPVGSIGDIGCFSMYVAHLLTSGVGGIATTSNPDYAVKMRSLVNHGRDNIYISIDDDKDICGNELREVIARRFNFESVGHSYRITEIEAALALAQLDTYKEMIAKRQSNAAYLHVLLDGLPLQLPTLREGTSHSFMMFPIVVLSESKWNLCNYLEENGIETREMLRLTDQPVYRDMWNPEDYPVAEWLNDSGFYVGCHQDLGREDMEYIADTIRKYYERKRA